MSKHIRTSSGFALLETLIAIVVFSIGVLGIIALQAQASQFSGDSEDRSRAGILANEIVSVMWQERKDIKLTGAISAPALANWQGRVANPMGLGLPGGVGTVSAPDAAGVITVSITWVSVSKQAATSSAASSAAASSAGSSAASSASATPNSIYTTKIVLPDDTSLD